MRVVRIKDRFTNPTDAGWADTLVNLVFEDDGNGHVCEVQLVHNRMWTVRKEQGAHHGYAQARTAAELLEAIGEPLDAAQPANASPIKLLDAPPAPPSTDLEARTAMLEGQLQQSPSRPPAAPQRPSPPRRSARGDGAAGRQDRAAGLVIGRRIMLRAVAIRERVLQRL